MSQGKRLHFEHKYIVALYLVLADVVSVNAAYYLALMLRFDLKYSMIPEKYLYAFGRFAPVYTLAAIVIFWALRMYKSILKYASISELNHIVAATIFTTAFQVVGITLLYERMPISYYMIGCFFQFAFTVTVRFAYRFVSLERKRREQSAREGKNVMIIGAGAAGQLILKEVRNSHKLHSRACCLIDDDPNKWDRTIDDVPIVGGRDCILKAVKDYQIEQILVAIPTASAEDKRNILNICKETDCELKILPGLYQMANGQVSMSKMKAVAVEDLLGRDPIKVNMDDIFRQIKGKTILVTGGGGSIGSELCRQVAAHEPKQLVIFDIYENNAYEIEQELKRKYPQLKLAVLIGSVRDSRRITSVFETYKPDIVYHAAAHKHVPLMETSPNESIKNNVVGTYKTAYAAMMNGVQRFVLISTDKAVNPTSIMGASKRLCEMVIQSMDAISKSGRYDLLPKLYAHTDEENEADTFKQVETFAKDATQEKVQIESVNNKERRGTQFVAVRFGNVLGSNGSVIPLFKKQIEAGGPVTVTHPDIIRYFMTIPEAVSLVMQAGTYAWGGEIFVLDMGEPVKIDTLARNLIRLSGYEPDVDIKVTYTGLRPGEKLFEEKLMMEEGMKKTDNALIHIGKPIPFDTEQFLKQLVELAKASYDNSDTIVEQVKQIVTTFNPVGANPTGEECKPSWVQAKEEAAVTKE